MNPDVPKTDLAALRARMDMLNAQDNVVKIKSPLDGREIMDALDVGPGRLLKDAKEFLVNEVLDGRLSPDDKPSAISAIRKWYAIRRQVIPD